MTEFPYIRASQALAHGKLFDKRRACTFYDVKSGTYDGWVNKLKTDRKLMALYEDALTKLKNEWQTESINTLKKGLHALNSAFDHNPFKREPLTIPESRAWGYNVDCAGRALKGLGDLVIGTHVLTNDDDDDDDE